MCLGERQIQRYPLPAPRSGNSEGEGRVRVVDSYLPLALKNLKNISIAQRSETIKAMVSAGTSSRQVAMLKMPSLSTPLEPPRVLVAAKMPP